MFAIDKPELSDELLAHYGIKGMKWGRRRGSSVTGVSRFRGALMDRNAREISRVSKASKGQGRLVDRASYKARSAILGKRAAENYTKYRLKDLKDQNSRLKSGKTTVQDKLRVAMTTSMFDLMVSVKPK